MGIPRLAGRFSVLSLAFAAILPASPVRAQEAPRVLDDRLELTLVAREPDIVTPIGAVFDSRGRLLVIESHTHQRPKEYTGPATDRIRIVEDTDGDGRADRFRTFHEGTEATMSLARGPDGWLYVATRMKVFRIRDSDGDDRADEEETVAHLETRGNYPHNGLAGLTFDGAGRLVFGMGENLGAPYILVGSDGTRLRGSGEGGVFRCDARGAGVVRLATGFWNPFGICVDARGRIFAVGNDPDGSPPCRLVHVVPTGDYGFQFRYGRSGRHPLQAWNGELPGTLPMAAGTGEAPSAVIEYHGRLWVTSWGEYRIERFELVPVGASFRARREVVVQGDAFFRPVDFAVAPDGSLYFTDWVDRSYPVHGRGRIWRLAWKKTPPKDALPPLSPEEEKARRAATAFDAEALASGDPFLRQAAVAGLLRSGDPATMDGWAFEDARARLGWLQAVRWRMESGPGDERPAAPLATLERALNDPDAGVRLYGVRWAADWEVRELRPAVERQLARTADATPELFQASIAAIELLDTGRTTFDPKNAANYFLRTLQDDSRPPALRALAARLVAPQNAAYDSALVRKLLAAGDAALAREAVRTLALSPRADSPPLLAEIAKDAKQPAGLRADAVAGLAFATREQLPLLRELAGQDVAEVRREAERALALAESPPPRRDLPPADDVDAWLRRVEGKGDAEAGWRVFFGAGSGRCAACHRFEGRGEDVGPDLTLAGRRMSERRLLESMLVPSREIAPQFVPWTIVASDGRVLVGLARGVNEMGDRERFVAPDGKTFELAPHDIESRQLAKTSLMPEGLLANLSPEDIRNLLALLGSTAGEARPAGKDD
jgi:putative membrane-bound dehydrogenase-like protein